MGMTQNQQPVTVTPSPVATGIGVGTLQKHSFVSPTAGGGGVGGGGDFDAQQGAFLEYVTNTKDKEAGGRRSLLIDNVELSEAFMKANEYRSELTSLLEDIEEVLDW